MYPENTEHTSMPIQSKTSISLHELNEIPTDLFIAILANDYKLKNENKNSVVTLPNIQYKQGKQFHQSFPNNNSVLLWIHYKWTEQKQQTLQNLGKFFTHNEDYMTEIRKYVPQYLYKCLLATKLQFNFAQFKKYLTKQLWYEIFLYFVKESIEQQKVQLQNQLLQQFCAQFQEVFIEQYLFEPSITLFSIFKNILELSASIKPQYIASIRKLFTQKYLQHLELEKSKQNRSNFSKQAERTKIFHLLKLLQLFHIADTTFQISQFSLNHYFMKRHLYTCLCDFQTKGANALAINIYGAMMKQLDLFDDNIQVFTDIYLTLDCYGMHLIKDIWDRFYVLCRNSLNKQNIPEDKSLYYIYPISELLHIILNKVQQHSNHNVPKYCIQSLLAASPQDTTPIFENLQDTVYGSLVEILNTGTHYNDITHFHQDSKIYFLTRSFYLGYYNILAQNNEKEKFREYLKKLLKVMNKYITFQHCIIAYIGILSQIPSIKDQQGKPLKLLGKEQADILVELTNRFLVKLTFRKRHKLLESVLVCFKNSIDLQQIGLKYFISNILMKLPSQVIQIQSKHNNIPEIYHIIVENFGTQLKQRIAQLTPQLSNTYQQIISQKDFHDNQQEYKQQIQNYFSLVKELSIIWVIHSWESNQKSNNLINQIVMNDLQILVNSSYAHPLQHAATIFTISNIFTYSNTNIMKQIVKSNVKLQQNLLIVLTLNSKNKFIDRKHLSICLQTIAASINESSNDPQCKNYAKFIQYTLSQLTEQSDNEKLDYFITLLLNAIKYKMEYTQNYKAIQDCFYTLFENVQKLDNISPKHKLRIQLILFTILSHDFQFAWDILEKKKPHYITQMRDFCNLYDYEHYDEVFRFYMGVGKAMSKAHQKGLLSQEKWLQFSENVCEHLEQAVKTMLHNLDYGVHRKQVVSSTECIVKMAILLGLNTQSANSINMLLEIGEKYWGFQRHTVFTLFNELQYSHMEYWRYGQGLLKLLHNFVLIEEYRGEDSAILLPQHNLLRVYKEKMLHKEADYDGTTIRFVVIENVYTRLNKLIERKKQGHQNNEAVKFWLDLFNRCFEICMTENSREKMFLTGSHKTKIKLWQFLMVFPHFLDTYCTTQQYKHIVLRCLQSMIQNNLQQIKHYAQTFMMKLIYLDPIEEIMGWACQIVMNQLLTIQGQSSLFKNVSYMMIAGLILQLYYHQGLYSVLFSSVCSHIAYYRGLSQYFCYRMIGNAQSAHLTDLKYVLILYQEFLKDEDAVKLTNKLEGIVQNYKTLVKGWNIYDNLLKEKPTLNGQVVSENHYINKLKYLGHQLVKQHKHQDGFMPYKEIWKKIIKQSKDLYEQKEEIKENQSSFQRKIDPSLDDLYSFEPVKIKNKNINQLKVLVISAEQIAFYGHMARVGEILGISELCIPTRKIIDMEDFYNVSVTAQKWLKITEHGFERVQKQKQVTKVKVDKKAKQNVKPLNKSKKMKEPQEEIEQEFEYIGRQKIEKILEQHKAEGYKLYLIHKSSNNLIQDPSSLHLNKKSLLIIDELNFFRQELQHIADSCISFNSYYSYHVQATIFIWEYFKKFSLTN